MTDIAFNRAALMAYKGQINYALNNAIETGTIRKLGVDEEYHVCVTSMQPLFQPKLATRLITSNSLHALVVIGSTTKPYEYKGEDLAPSHIGLAGVSLDPVKLGDDLYYRLVRARDSRLESEQWVTTRRECNEYVLDRLTFYPSFWIDPLAYRMLWRLRVVDGNGSRL